MNTTVTFIHHISWHNLLILKRQWLGEQWFAALWLNALRKPT